MSAQRDDVVVVGGGVIGVSIAEALAHEGLAVRLLESDGVGAAASGAAAGMLAPISEARAEDPMLPLGLASLARFEALCGRLADETGIDPELCATGSLNVAFDPEAAAGLRRHAAASSARLAAAALPPCPLEWIDREELLELEPDLAIDAEGAIFAPQERHLRPPLLVRALEASARSRGVRIDAGVRALRLLREGQQIIGLESSAGPLHAGEVVLAAGPWTPSLLETIGLGPPNRARLPIEPVRGQILALEPPLPSSRSIVRSDDVYFVPKRDGSWIVGATEESVGFDRRVTLDGVAWLLSRARRIFPGLGRATFGRAWAGLRPVSGDGRPYLGPLPGWRGLQLAAGHGRNGVLLSAISAQLICDSILGKGGPDEADPWSAARWLRS